MHLIKPPTTLQQLDTADGVGFYTPANHPSVQLSLFQLSQEH